MAEVSTPRRLAVVPIAIAVAGAALYRGGVDWPVQLAVAVLCIAGLALAGGRSGRLDVNWLVAGLGLAFAAMLFQLIPLPPFLLRLLSPNAADLFQRQLGPFGAWPTWRPLALDVGAGWRELAKAAACVAAAAAGVVLGDARKQRDRLFVAVAVGGVAVVLAGLGAALLGMGPITEPHVTFLNPNHLAGYLGLTCWIALGFALRDRGPARALWLMAFAVTASGVFLSLSRGGIAAFFLGAAVFGLLSVRRNAEEKKREHWLWLAATPVAVSLVLAIAAYLALDRIVGEMRTVVTAAGDSKIQMWPIAVDMIHRFPLTGIGKGAFETVFPSFKLEPDAVTFVYLENEWLQALVDLGVVAGLALVAACGWAWLKAARSRELSRVEIGALAGTAALAAHNAVDFSLEVVSVAVPFALLLGLLTSGESALRLRTRLSRLAPAALAALALLGSVLWHRHPTDGDAARIAAVKSSAEALSLAKMDLAWHPADYLPAATIGAKLVAENHCAEALPWLTRAMVQNATFAEPHRFAARCLSAGHKDLLARSEYRLAFMLGDADTLREVIWRYPKIDDMLEATPDTPQALNLLGLFLLGRHPRAAADAFERAWAEFGEPRALSGMARATWASGDAKRTLAAARQLEKADPQDSNGYLYASLALRTLGDAKGAQEELELGTTRVPGSPDINLSLATMLTTQKRFAEARALIESALPRQPWESADVHLHMASLLAAQGRTTEAIEEVRRAISIWDREPNSYLTLANYYAKAGRYAEAVETVEHAAAMPNAAPGGYADRLAELRRSRQDQVDRFRSQGVTATGQGLPANP